MDLSADVPIVDLYQAIRDAGSALWLRAHGVWAIALTAPALALLTILATCAPPAAAATFNVESTLDAVDASPGDGVCATAAGDCTLRAAVQEANASPDADEILLPVGVFSLTIPGTDEDASATGDLDVIETLTIKGASQASTILDGSAIDRVLDVPESASPVATLTLSDLTVRNGTSPNEIAGIRAFRDLTLIDVTVTRNNGIGIASIGSRLFVEHCTISANTHGGNSDGGGIATNTSTSVTIISSIITNNFASLGSGGIELLGARGPVIIHDAIISDNEAVASGGGLGADHSDGPIRISNSTVTGNRAGAWGGGLVINASGLDVDPANTPVSIVNSTITGNKGREGAGLAITNNAALATLSNVTITDNMADALPFPPPPAHGGGVWISNRNGGSVEVGNSIIAGNSAVTAMGPDCSGDIISRGYNLIGNPEDCVIQGDIGSNLVGVAPGLGPLADNGGPTPTHALLAGSVAVDAGNPLGCTDDNGLITADQRGVARPQGAACDIGAYEFSCGNGILDIGEECDDGNLIDNDGCSSACLLNRIPACSGAFASVSRLWPPNGRFVDVRIQGVTDPDGDPISITITSVTQTEHIGAGVDRTCPDATGIGTPVAHVRAERLSTGDGRIYTVAFNADDGRRGVCTGTVTVCVPHDQGKRTRCIDEGQIVDSTGPCSSKHGFGDL